MAGPVAVAIVLSKGERCALERRVRRRKIAHADAMRAEIVTEIVLLPADCLNNCVIGMSKSKRFMVFVPLISDFAALSLSAMARTTKEATAKSADSPAEGPGEARAPRSRPPRRPGGPGAMANRGSHFDHDPSHSNKSRCRRPEPHMGLHLRRRLPRRVRMRWAARSGAPFWAAYSAASGQGGCYYRYPSGEYTPIDPRYCY